jgi:hypothetical protein
VDAHGRAGEISLKWQQQGGRGEGIGEGEDSFSTRRRVHCAPSARVALGFGDAWDLLV